jgi:hypothetical protein
MPDKLQSLPIAFVAAKELFDRNNKMNPGQVIHPRALDETAGTPRRPSLSYSGG